MFLLGQISAFYDDDDGVPVLSGAMPYWRPRYHAYLLLRKVGRIILYRGVAGVEIALRILQFNLNHKWMTEDDEGIASL